ncbi:MAG: TetR/AcrR family transcriptional regulator [Anaerovoracaceae bacterium]
MKKNPEQTKRTKQKLKDAYWKLFSTDQKPTVDAISQLTGYNRCTFYRYYMNTDAVLAEIESDLCLEIYNIALAAFEKKDTSIFLREMTSLYNTKGDYICTLLGENGDPGFMVMMREKMAPIILKFFNLEAHPYSNLLVTFISSALSQTLSEWYKAGKKPEIEELMPLISRLIYSGLSGITSDNKNA